MHWESPHIMANESLTLQNLQPLEIFYFLFPFKREIFSCNYNFESFLDFSLPTKISLYPCRPSFKFQFQNKPPTQTPGSWPLLPRSKCQKQGPPTTMVLASTSGPRTQSKHAWEKPFSQLIFIFESNL